MEINYPSWNRHSKKPTTYDSENVSYTERHIAYNLAFLFDVQVWELHQTLILLNTSFSLPVALVADGNFTFSMPVSAFGGRAFFSFDYGPSSESCLSQSL